MEHPVKIEGLSQKAQDILNPDAPGPAKMMAASGIAPLPPDELVYVLYSLAYNADIALGDKARATLKGLPDKILLATISSKLSPLLLDGLVHLLIKRTLVVERVVLNPLTLPETIIWVAKSVHSEKVLEIICSNEDRLLKHPEIIESLYGNKYSRMSSVDRVIELAIRNNIELTGISSYEEIKKALEGELIFEASDEPTPDDIAFSNGLAVGEENDASDEEIAAVINNKDENDEDNKDEQSKLSTKEDASEKESSKAGNLQASLSSMSISQKIRMGTLGTSSQRSVLIRDSNKLVVMASLKSPAVNDGEVRKFSMLKTLPDEAVRYIASKRDWTKQYAIKLNLVNNPRTPVEISMRFLPHLRPNDLRALERSKDVQGVVTNAARELRKKRTK